MPRVLPLLLLVALPLSAAPVPKAKGKAPDVAGTKWVATDADRDGDVIAYTFEAGGKLVYSYGGKTYDNGTWKQDGDDLTWETNGHYADYTLAFKEGQFVGSAKNVNGKSWDVTIRPEDEKK